MLKSLSTAAGGAAEFPRLPLCSNQLHAPRRRAGAVSAAHLRRLTQPVALRGLRLAKRPETAHAPGALPPRSGAPPATPAAIPAGPPYSPGHRGRCSSPGRAAATEPPGRRSLRDGGASRAAALAQSRPQRPRTRSCLWRAAAARSGTSCASAGRLRDGRRESCLY